MDVYLYCILYFSVPQLALPHYFLSLICYYILLRVNDPSLTPGYTPPPPPSKAEMKIQHPNDGRTDRYNIMCSLVAHDRLQDDYEDDESSIDNRAIKNDSTVKELKSLGATFNFIDIWLHFFSRKLFCSK